MKFWRLYNSAEKEVGFVPQIVQPVFDGQYTDKNQLWNIHVKQIDNAIIIPKGYLHKRAKLTDLMSDSFLNNQRFVSEKLRKIIERYPCKGIQFADTEVITPKVGKIKANILHPFATDRSYIDMSQTEFQISTVKGEIINERLKLNSMKDFLEIREAHIIESKKYDDINLHKWISISKLFFKKNVDFGICSVFDVLYGGGVGFYVSQKLKDEILNEECTGIIFCEIDEQYP